MLLELPYKYKRRFIICSNNELKIFQAINYEDLMYDLTKAIRGKRCIYCGKTLKRCNFTLDHRFPRETGGISITNNLYPCCEKCNVAKGNLTHEEFLSLQFTGEISKMDRRLFLNGIYEENQVIFKNTGFKLPENWVNYETINNIIYTDPKCYTKGKKFIKISKFFSKYYKLPRPIILDKNNRLMEGYTVLLFAREAHLGEVPAVKLENVEYC